MDSSRFRRKPQPSAESGVVSTQKGEIKGSRCSSDSALTRRSSKLGACTHQRMLHTKECAIGRTCEPAASAQSPMWAQTWLAVVTKQDAHP